MTFHLPLKDKMRDPVSRDSPPVKISPQARGRREPPAKFSLDALHIIIYTYVYMKTTADALRLFSDPARIRSLLILDRKELCVCQVMGVLDMPQPLVSRTLSSLHKAGLLDARRDGKMMFYRLKPSLPEPMSSLMRLLRKELAGDETHGRDLQSLGDCLEYQKKSGKCSMETFLRFMQERKRKGKK
jgi:ArsR family transcriptional regulator